jgi:hypothetical protein
VLLFIWQTKKRREKAEDPERETDRSEKEENLQSSRRELWQRASEKQCKVWTKVGQDVALVFLLLFHDLSSTPLSPPAIDATNLEEEEDGCSKTDAATTTPAIIAAGSTRRNRRAPPKTIEAAQDRRSWRRNRRAPPKTIEAAWSSPELKTKTFEIAGVENEDIRDRRSWRRSSPEAVEDWRTQSTLPELKTELAGGRRRLANPIDGAGVEDEDIRRRSCLEFVGEEDEAAQKLGNHHRRLLNIIAAHQGRPSRSGLGATVA